MSNDVYLAMARKAYEQYGRLSAPYLQRKLNISYNKAIEIIGIVTKELINNKVRD